MRFEVITDDDDDDEKEEEEEDIEGKREEGKKRFKFWGKGVIYILYN